MAIPLKTLVPVIAAGSIVLAASLTAPGLAQAQPSPTQEIPCSETRTEYAQCAPASPAEQKTEQYVLKEVLAGATVRLEEGSVLRGCFVHDLLMKKLGVPHTGITIEGATIKGPIDIRNEDIEFHVELIDCKFQDDFNMKRSHFSKGLSLEGSSFGSKFDGPGRLDAESATIDFDFTLDNCTFRNCLTFFKSMRVGVDLSMRGTKFYDVDFTGANIGSNLFADKVDPQDTRQTDFFGAADFEGMNVGLDANLDAQFHSNASFETARLSSLAIEKSAFEGDVNFKGTKIDNFYLGDSPVKRFKGNLMIEDLTFQYMSPEDLDQLKEFAEKSNSTQEQARYNTQFYTTLESILRKHGHDDWGNEVYIAGKRKEREHLPSYAKAWGYFLDGFIGYGRHVGRLLWWSAFFIAFGCYVFWSKDSMEMTKGDDTKRQERSPSAPVERKENVLDASKLEADKVEAAANKNYCPFLYALDLFIPIVGLGYADIWTPSQPLGRIYKPVHAIVGHLFVPIGLAAWTGIIK
jgi:hypothetical protein